MFDGTVGNWDTVPVNLELKPGSKSFNSKYYPVPRINKKTFHKEIKSLVEIGVLATVQKIQYGTPVFIILEKKGTARFITEYLRLNQQLVRKPYPLPRIVDTMQQLEGFRCAIELDLNMGYYTIRISPASQDMTIIVTEFGKFRYNCLPMDMCDLGDIFQAKVDKVLSDIEVTKMYIDDILVLRKGCFSNHIGHPRMIFGRLQIAGLKVSAPKCSFGLKDLPYLRYVITRKCIKPDPNKVQGIMDLGRPATTTENRALIGMVHFYRDMWRSWSHILAPLKEAASDPKVRK